MENLEFRPLRIEDAEAMFPEIDGELTKYFIGWEPKATIEELRAEIADKIARHEPDTVHLSVFLKDSGEFIGYCGIEPDDFPGEREIDFWVKHSAQGKGHAQEMLRFLLKWAKDQGMGSVVYSVTDGNIPSEHIISKTPGKTFLRQFYSEKRGERKLVRDYLFKL